MYNRIIVEVVNDSIKQIVVLSYNNTQVVCKTKSNAAKCRERPGLLRIDNYIVCAAL